MYEGSIHGTTRTRAAAGAVALPQSPEPVLPDIREPQPATDVVGALLRGRWIAAAGLVLGLVVAVAFLLLVQPRYSASTTVIIDPSDLKIVDKGLRESSSFSDAQVAQVENEVRVITSTNVLGAVVDAEHLDRNPEFGGGGPSKVRAMLQSLGLAGAAPDDDRLNAIRALAKDITVKREERTYVVQIVVTTHDAAESVRLADAVVAAFLASSAHQHLDASRRIATSLKGRLGDLRQSVEDADQKLVDYRQKHNLVTAVGQSVTEAQLAEASSALVQRRKSVEDLRSRVNQVLGAQRSGNPGAIPDALQSTTIMALRSQLALVVRQRDDLQATLGPRYPDVLKVKGEEHGLRDLLKEEIGRIASVTRSDLVRAVADQASAQANFDALKASVSTNSQVSVPLRQLEREVDAARTVYDAFLVRTREVAEQEQIDPTDIRVISTAQSYEARAWPPRPTVVLAGLGILGLVIGCGFAVLRETPWWPFAPALESDGEPLPSDPSPGYDGRVRAARPRGDRAAESAR